MQEEQEDKIVELPVRPRFSSGEINSLFLGLCRLVKRLAQEEAEEQCRRKLAYIEASYKNEIENLRLINEGLLKELGRKQKNKA